MAAEQPALGVLLDLDGVLYVGDEAIDGARESLAEIRRLSAGLRLVTNTTSRSRREVAEHLRSLRFDAEDEEVLTPAAMAVSYCRERGFASVALFVGEPLREDLLALERSRGAADALVLGDMGEAFGERVLNEAFRLLMDGAELVVLQHNRYWRRADGLALDVGAYAAALEYATGREGVVVGKPALTFFRTAMADMGLQRGVMVGDDVEADVAGAIAAGLSGVLVRTGKYRPDALSLCEVEPSAIVDSIADVPALLERLGSEGAAS